MPYVNDFERPTLDKESFAETEGQLNYEITTLVSSFIQKHGGMRYSRVNEVIGAMECAKLELYRRLAAPYEDKKCQENGDAYPQELQTT